MKWRRRVWRAAAVALGAAVVAGGGAAFRQFWRVKAAESLATAPARRGDFLVMVRCRGELRARRSVQINAPVNVPELRIVWLATPGSMVKQGDLVVRFDPSSAQQQLNERKAALQQAQAALEQAEAQARITAEQDKRELARLQAEESKIDLALAGKDLRVQEATIQLHEASDRARIASFARQRDKAREEVEITEYRLAQMELKAPISGLINFLPNYSQGWMNAKPFKVGDQAWPGGALAEIPDLSTLEMEGKVEEIDRGRISAGQDVRVRVDSIPELSFPASLDAISPLTEQAFEFPPTRSFRGYARIEKPDSRLRPGMNGSMDVVVSRIPDAVSVPAKAIFTRDGKPVVYTAVSGSYHQAPVEILARNPDEVAVSGLKAGTHVTLVEPELESGP
jgi:multidrug efflux pump subunit AcrA (membrane-fusion protein)